MSMIFSRTAIIPVWLVVFALFAWSGSPMPVAMAVLLLIVGVTAPMIMLMLWKERLPQSSPSGIPLKRRERVKTRSGSNPIGNVAEDGEITS